ncbi:MAG: peptidoglycan editing factor PgeF [Pseudomonadota bacterium]
MLRIPSLEALPRVRHGFFTRQGGVSGGLYSSLNCGFGSGDRAEHVEENRARAMAQLAAAPNSLVTVYQIHSDQVAVVESPWARDQAPKADGLATKRPGVTLGILTADCVPVLFAEPEAGVIGGAHAGWRGALDGILEAVVTAMERLGANRQSISAGIGPCIAKASYEVGPEFPDPFLAQSAENSDFFATAERSGHFMFDLEGYVARRLSAAGIGSVEAAACDTCADEARFFSYRRACKTGETDYGRGLSAITLEA